MSVKENLWPEIIVQVKREPVQILNEQGEALAQRTNGRLYGEVWDNPLSDDGKARYDFYICTTDKPHRFLLLSIECPFASDYPVALIFLDEERFEAADSGSYKQALAQILQSDETAQILQRMLYLATTITSYRYDAGGRVIGDYDRDEETLTDEILGIIRVNGRVLVSVEAIKDALRVSDSKSARAYIVDLCNKNSLTFQFDAMKGAYHLSGN